MAYALQCVSWIAPAIPKGSYATKTYANKRTNKKPSLVLVMTPNQHGELTFDHWVMPKAPKRY